MKVVQDRAAVALHVFKREVGVVVHREVPEPRSSVRPYVAGPPPRRDGHSRPPLRWGDEGCALIHQHPRIANNVVSVMQTHTFFSKQWQFLCGAILEETPS